MATEPRSDLPQLTSVVLDQWEASALADEAAGLVSLDEVMLPYMLDDSGRTVAELYREKNDFLALESAVREDA